MHIYVVTLEGHVIGLYSANTDAANIMKRLSDRCVIDICHLNSETLLGHDILDECVSDTCVAASIQKICKSGVVNQEARRRRSAAVHYHGAS